jgi:hypothetical protein
MLKTIAKKINLREKLIESELNSFLQQNNRNTSVTARQSQREIKVTENLSSITPSRTQNPYEKELIRLLFSGKEDIVEFILEKVGVEEFTDPNLKSLAEIVSHGLNEHRISRLI